ncbi:sulfatase family protein [Maribacter arenosus]|uniref:Sulfatase n=1 Tax=Maribacter arenosus TaxID=1854708 RepID=A0ABR7V9E0_9FLAO|nr:sulfatase [Maribacter arenosus]MBD0850222.1 sulfatase [Maribacter arenosus]
MAYSTIFWKLLYSLSISMIVSQTPIHGQIDPSNPPNFIIIFADDLGYGDLSSYGNPTIHTPNLDRMAHEGQKWTNFYAAASVCTPSRAALLTGRLPVRSGMSSNIHRVLFPDSKNGLPASEITLAEQLKKAGYASACIGKWHLGHKEQYLPTNNGFDSYFGIPYSNDMDFIGNTDYNKLAQESPIAIKMEDYNVPLLQNTKIIERPANQNNITQRYSEEAVSFIKEHKDEPFFIYLAHNLPHIPLFASGNFLGSSKRGLYGDVVEEIDNGVGLILKTLKETGLAENTIVVFTSDNGPWLPFKTHAGSAGPLKAGKGTTWEGGMREPTIFWGPGLVKPGLVSELGSTMDIFATFSTMAGIELPKDRIIDGKDLSETLIHHKPSPRNSMLYYRGTELYAARLGDFKAHFITEGEYGQFGELEVHDPPLLYNVNQDISENFNIAGNHPEIIEQIKKLVEDHKSNLVKGKDQLAERE